MKIFLNPEEQIDRLIWRPASLPNAAVCPMWTTLLCDPAPGGGLRVPRPTSVIYRAPPAVSMVLSDPPPTAAKEPRVRGPMPAKRPDWFHVPAPGGTNTRFADLQETVGGLGLSTVCQEAQCPNIGECWNGGTATIMLLGDTCTRGCKFCAVKTDAKPEPPDENEPWNTADAVAQWGIDYVVLTSVDRDDLPDGGSGHFAQTVGLLKFRKPELKVECLVSDFAGDDAAVRTLAQSGLDVFAHNVETVRRLQPFVRDKRANYEQSLEVLRAAKRHAPDGSRLFTKTSLMLGLGETDDEVMEAMRDLRKADVDVVTFGQYLRPTEHHLSIVEYVTPDKFDWFREQAEQMGFKYVASVRARTPHPLASSCRAAQPNQLRPGCLLWMPLLLTVVAPLCVPPSACSPLRVRWSARHTRRGNCSWQP